MSDVPTIELVVRWRDQADQGAAAEVFHRYVDRLIGLARSRMSPKLARRVDAEDVVQSACRSFFMRVQDGRLLFQPGSEFWQLLAAITIHKVFRQVEYHTAGKRSMQRDEEDSNQGSQCRIAGDLVACDPTPDEVLSIVEEQEKAMENLNALHRQMIEMRLQDCGLAEIAAATDRSERMVRIVLADFGKKLQRRLRQVAET